MKITLKQIKKDVKFSPRIEMGTVEEIAKGYAECFDQLPPITVFKVQDDENYLLVDGWHRYAAAELLEREDIEADVKAGSVKDAKEFALLSNLKHGYPLTRKEKRHVITEFLKLHPKRANNWIASDLGTKSDTVQAVRVLLESNSQIGKIDKFLTKDGREIPRGNAVTPKKEPEPNEKVEADPEPEPVIIIPHLGKYQLNKSHQADCLEALQSLPEASIDLLFADPPYNLGVKYGQSDTDKKPTGEYFNWCSKWFMASHRVLKPGGSLYVMHYPDIAAQWKQQLDLMFTFRHWLTWVYPSNIGQANGNWRKSHRAILYYVKGSSPAYFKGDADPQPYKNPDDLRIKHIAKNGTTPYDWWEYDLVKNVSKAKTEWANQLPVELVKRVIVTSCPKNGVVCDPFMGSGTTAEAAVLSERQWIGFDKEHKSCGITASRIEQVDVSNTDQQS